jgi:hypothetical protein
VNNTSANYIVAIALLMGCRCSSVRRAVGSHRPQAIMMAGCLWRRVSYLPIYKAMQAAAGSNVVTAVSQRNPVTGPSA